MELFVAENITKTFANHTALNNLSIKVINLEGEGSNKKATVFFPEVGQKQLLLKFAKLKIL